MKIVAIGSWNFTQEQKNRLEKAGQLTFVDSPDSDEAWLKAVQGANVIASDGDHLLANLDKLKNVFVTYPYIELGAFDSERLTTNGVTIANAQGGNRASIVEWTMFMVLALFRQFPTGLNAKEYEFIRTQSLVDKKVLVIGKGSIGSEVGKRCEAFGMQVDYFNRGDNLAGKTIGKDLTINCLNVNSTSKNLLDDKFFMSLPKGSYYVSFVRPWTYDVNGMVKSLDADILAGAAIDCDPEGLGDTKNPFYKKVSSHSKIYATPHIAGATTQASVNGTEILVQNIEAYIAGNPQNVLEKK
jgi:phosphoglycerate dehydrogenase-like enzyme